MILRRLFGAFVVAGRYRACAVTLIAVCACGLLLSGCGGKASSDDSSSNGSSTRAAPAADLDRVVSVDGKRGLYVRCTGSGSPTVLMEGGDEDTSDSYPFAEPSISEVARTCVYDRANLGRSDPAAAPRGLSDLVNDLEALLQAAKIPGPYVLVGISGGGYISAGYAYEHPDEVAGIVFVEVPAPFRNPPRVIVEETDPNNPANIERRDYLQVEKDAWAARKRIGDIPVTIISNEYSTAEIDASPFPSEARGMRRNVSDQKGWLLLSPHAKQMVVHTGHAVEEENPQLVIDAILDVANAAQ
jgi:pimeloyl-ACP methyl ester carboxylesterase